MNGCNIERTLLCGSITWGYSIEAGQEVSGKSQQFFKGGFQWRAKAQAELNGRVCLGENDWPVASGGRERYLSTRRSK